MEFMTKNHRTYKLYFDPNLCLDLFYVYRAFVLGNGVRQIIYAYIFINTDIGIEELNVRLPCILIEILLKIY